MTARIEIQHGTKWAYQHHRCRCDQCRAANTAAAEKWRRRRGTPTWAEYVAAVAGRTHGIRATYGHGCRCDECRAAERAYRTHYRTEKGKP